MVMWRAEYDSMENNLVHVKSNHKKAMFSLISLMPKYNVWQSMPKRTED